MSQRLNYYEQSPELAQKLFEFGQTVKNSSLGNTLLDLVNIRPSQRQPISYSHFFRSSDTA